jgi:hypothetical protein
MTSNTSVSNRATCSCRGVERESAGKFSLHINPTSPHDTHLDDGLQHPRPHIDRVQYPDPALPSSTLKDLDRPLIQPTDGLGTLTARLDTDDPVDETFSLADEFTITLIGGDGNAGDEGDVSTGLGGTDGSKSSSGLRAEQGGLDELEMVVEVRVGGLLGSRWGRVEGVFPGGRVGGVVNRGRARVVGGTTDGSRLLGDKLAGFLHGKVLVRYRVGCELSRRGQIVMGLKRPNRGLSTFVRSARAVGIDTASVNQSRALL